MNIINCLNFKQELIGTVKVQVAFCFVHVFDWTRDGWKLVYYEDPHIHSII